MKLIVDIGNSRIKLALFKNKNLILTQSKNVIEFEKKWSKWLGVKFSVFVNSGSSANLLATFASCNPWRKNRFKKDCLYVFVSQSGETADTYAALDLCNKNKMKTCSIVNVVESSIARDSKFVLPIHCGPEIGVASTKAFLGQILVLYILILKISFLRKDIKKQL